MCVWSLRRSVCVVRESNFWLHGVWERRGRGAHHLVGVYKYRVLDLVPELEARRVLEAE